MIEKMKYRIHFISKMLPYMKGKTHLLLWGLLIQLVATILSYLNPLLYRRFFNHVVIWGEIKQLYIVVIGYVLICCGNIALNCINLAVSCKFDYGMQLKMKSELMLRYWSMPISEISKLQIGDMKIRIEDESNGVLSFFKKQSIGLLLAYVNLILSIAFSLLIDWRLTLFSCSIIPVTLWVDHRLGIIEGKINAENRTNDENMVSWLHTSLLGWKEIKLYNIKNEQKNVFTDYLNKYANYFEKWINLWVVKSLIVPKIKNDLILKLALYLIGGILIIENKIMIGDLLVFIIIYENMMRAICEISGCNSEILSNKYMVENVTEILAYSSPIIQLTGKEFTINRIEINHVHFTYPGSNCSIFENVSLCINKGDCVAMKGPSGCGKTTLLNLMTGILSPDNGCISYSGVKMSDDTFEMINKRIAYCSQNSHLMNMSIRDNLTMVAPNATERDLQLVCEKTGIYNYIKTLPQGFDTVLGQNGLSLSGGQRQRLLLARMFLRDVDVYILDEATDNIDVLGEKDIHRLISNIAKDKIVILVSHRPSVYEQCNVTVELANTVVAYSSRI